jgi:hypothetical protein
VTSVVHNNAAKTPATMAHQLATAAAVHSLIYSIKKATNHPMRNLIVVCLLLLQTAGTQTFALQQPPQTPQSHSNKHDSLLSRRRSLLFTATPSIVATAVFWQAFSTLPATAATAADLTYATSTTGNIQWADAKIGTGATKQKGDIAAIDYVLQTSGARYGAKIYSSADYRTADTNTPYRWTLGDGTTIQGLEDAILGGNGIDAMRAGGIRRVIIPQELAYASLGMPGKLQDCQVGKGVGPIPPDFEGYQRFKNIYCNANRQYQPDIVMDIKLYGGRLVPKIE